MWFVGWMNCFFSKEYLPGVDDIFSILTKGQCFENLSRMTARKSKTGLVSQHEESLSQ